MSGKVCRLCLNMYKQNISNTNNFQDRAMLKFTFPQIILGMTLDVTICCICTDLLKQFYNFKRKRINNTEDHTESGRKMGCLKCLICQYCVAELLYVNSEEPLKYHLTCCGFNIVPNVCNYICWNCNETVKKMFDFLQQCLTAQSKLHKKMKALNRVLNNSDLVDLVTNYNSCETENIIPVENSVSLEMVPKSSLITKNALIQFDSHKVLNLNCNVKQPEEDINFNLDDCLINDVTLDLLLDGYLDTLIGTDESLVEFGTNFREGEGINLDFTGDKL